MNTSNMSLFGAYDVWRERALRAKEILAEIKRLRVADYGSELAERVREINEEVWE